MGETMKCDKHQYNIKDLKIVLTRCDQDDEFRKYFNTGFKKDLKIVLTRCDQDDKFRKYFYTCSKKSCQTVSMQCHVNEEIQKPKKTARSMVVWISHQTEIEIPPITRMH